jgi:hypothetical protein
MFAISSSGNCFNPELFLLTPEFCSLVDCFAVYSCFLKWLLGLNLLFFAELPAKLRASIFFIDSFLLKSISGHSISSNWPIPSIVDCLNCSLSYRILLISLNFSENSLSSFSFSTLHSNISYFASLSSLLIIYSS